VPPKEKDTASRAEGKSGEVLAKYWDGEGHRLRGDHFGRPAQSGRRAFISHKVRNARRKTRCHWCTLGNTSTHPNFGHSQQVMPFLSEVF
jgi:hypothetical protein